MGEYRKTVLRKLQSKEIDDYLLPVWERKQLNYPASCLEESERGTKKEVVGLGMKEIQARGSRRGNPTHFYFVLCNSNLEVIYEGSFESIKQAKRRPDYYEEYSIYYMSVKRNLQRLIAGKIVVGYDMGAMLNLLRLEHQDFIEIGYLYPHGLGLPCMIKLKSLAYQILNIEIEEEEEDYENGRYRGRRRRRGRYGYWGEELENDSSDMDERMPRRFEDDDGQDNSRRPKPFVMVATHVNVCLQLAKNYIEKGSGVFTNIQSTKKDLRDVNLMLEEAEIDRSRIVGLFQRGSRAVNIQIESDEYSSDWDYVCVIDTTATICSSLVKLHKVDVILFDKKTFESFIGQNDLPMLELFYLPAQCIIVNTFPTPFTVLPNLKKSLAYHIKKTDVKLVHYGKQFLRLFMHPSRNYSQAKLEKIGSGSHGAKEKLPDQGRRRYEQDYQQIDPFPQGFTHQLMAHIVDSYPESKLDPQYVKWKLLKLIHLEIRMVDEYLQYKEFDCIKDIKRVTHIWNELLTVCNQKDHYSGYKFLKAKLNELLEQAFSFKELYYFEFTVWLNLQKKYDEQEERRYQSYRYRRYRRGRIGRPYRPVPEMGEAMLSIYKGSIFQSSLMGKCKRIDYVDDQYDQEIQRRERQHEEEPKRQIVNLPQEFGNMKAFLGLAQFIEEKEQKGQSSFQQCLSPYFIKTQYFFQNNFIGKTNKDQDNLKQEIICLNNFRLLQHANLQNKLVQEAKSAIYKSYLTVMKEQVYVKTLVCLKYLPCYEYSHHLDIEIVKKFEDEWCIVEPKLDGVFATLYYVDNGWLVASKQSPDGRDFITKDTKITFKEEFLRIFNNLGFKLPDEDDMNKVFFFQLLSTNISNVLPKEKDGLILHGVRNMSNLQEKFPKYYAEKYGWQFLHTEDLNTSKLDQIAKISQERENFQGFVLKNKRFERLIIRNSAFLKKKWQKMLERLLAMPQYSFHNQKIERNKLVYFIYSEIVLKGWEEIYVKLFPEHSKLVQSILSYIKQVNQECQKLLKATIDIKDKPKQLDDAISNKRADILEYCFGHSNTTFPDLYKGRIHTSVNFDKTFNFILQHLNQFSNQ